MHDEPTLTAAEAAAGLESVKKEPGAKKPNPILVADKVVRRFGGLTAVDVDHFEMQKVASRASSVRTVRERRPSSTC